jgi:hypothetical protein
MQKILIFAPTAATRKLYQQTLVTRDRDLYTAKDAVELFVQLSLFEIDTIVLVHEGHEHEFNLILAVVKKKYDFKRVIVVSLSHRQKWYERYPSTRAFFESLEQDQ